MTRRLYTTRVTEDALQTQEPSAQTELETLLGLSSSPAVEDVGRQASDLRLDGQYRGQYAEMLSTELRELLSADALTDFAWYQIGGTAPDRGYYAVQSITGGRLTPQTDGVTKFDARLTQKGTRASHRRAVSTNPKSRSHPWGNDTTGYVGVPAAARKAQWLTFVRGQTQAATADDTVAAELGDVDRFDVETPPSGFETRPYLVYDLPHESAGIVNTAVFDTYGRSENNANGDFAWQQVHRTDHEFVGEVVIQNGRLELTLNESANTLAADRYTSGSWSSVSLTASDWQLFDVDLRRPGAAQVRARLVFEDTTDGSLFTLEAALFRGWDDVLLYSPDDLQVPSGLVTHLSPVAATTVIDPQPERTLIARSDL